MCEFLFRCKVGKQGREGDARWRGEERRVTLIFKQAVNFFVDKLWEKVSPEWRAALSLCTKDELSLLPKGLLKVPSAPFSFVSPYLVFNLIKKGLNFHLP